MRELQIMLAREARKVSEDRAKIKELNEDSMVDAFRAIKEACDDAKFSTWIPFEQETVNKLSNLGYTFGKPMVSWGEEIVEIKW